jgi:hypothetical protein
VCVLPVACFHFTPFASPTATALFRLQLLVFVNVYADVNRLIYRNADANINVR